MGVVCIVIGIFTTFFGRRFFPAIIALLGGIGSFLAVALVCSLSGMLWSLEGTGRGSIALTILSFIIATTIGIFVAYGLAKHIKLGASALGAIIGFFLGVVAYNVALNDHRNAYYLAGLSLGLALLFGGISVRYFTFITIFGTSLIGSYSTIRGISMFLGRFPNEILLFGEL
jgi:hypothetical protein